MTDDDKLQELAKQASPLRLERRLLRMERSVLEAEYRSYPEGLRRLHTLKDTLEAAQIRLNTARAYLTASNNDHLATNQKRVDDAGKKLLELEKEHRELLARIAPLNEKDLPPLVQKRQKLRAVENRIEELDEEIDFIELVFQKVVFARPASLTTVLSPGRCQARGKPPLANRFTTPRKHVEE